MQFPPMSRARRRVLDRIMRADDTARMLGAMTRALMDAARRAAQAGQADVSGELARRAVAVSQLGSAVRWGRLDPDRAERRAAELAPEPDVRTRYHYGVPMVDGGRVE